MTNYQLIVINELLTSLNLKESNRSPQYQNVTNKYKLNVYSDIQMS